MSDVYLIKLKKFSQSHKIGHSAYIINYLFDNRGDFQIRVAIEKIYMNFIAISGPFAHLIR
jgi:hypothetical protein